MQSRSWKSHEDINFNFYNPHIHHGIFRKCSDHPCSSKVVFSAFTVKNFDQLPCVHRSRSGPHFKSSPQWVYLSPGHSKSCHYFWALSYTATTILCGASLSTTTAISVDRLLALLLGLRYRQVVTVRRVMALVVTIWLSSILIAAVVYYSYLITLGMASAGLVLCIVISTFCYTKIYHTLRLYRAQVQDQGNQGQRNGEGSQLNKARYKKTVSTAVWIQMTLLACYLPFGLVGAVKAIFRLYVPSQSLIYAVTLSLLMSNSTINPLLYCWKIRDIRQAVRGTIRQFRCIFSEEA